MENRRGVPIENFDGKFHDNMGKSNIKPHYNMCMNCFNSYKNK